MRCFWNALRWAADGIRTTWVKEKHFRWQVLIMLAVFWLARWTNQSNPEWAILILVSASVLAAQTFNGALELTAEVLSSEYDPVIGTIKDVAAGAVFLTALASVAVFFLVILVDLPLLVVNWRRCSLSMALEVVGLLAVGGFCLWRRRD